ncbi:MAG: hypothetical protein WD810_03225 [Solirubrobacterales bacterium]
MVGTPALHELHASHERETEEIDVVGLHRGRVSVVGECKWTSKPISVSLLGEIEKVEELIPDGSAT